MCNEILFSDEHFFVSFINAPWSHLSSLTAKMKHMFFLSSSMLQHYMCKKILKKKIEKYYLWHILRFHVRFLCSPTSKKRERRKKIPSVSYLTAAYYKNCFARHLACSGLHLLKYFAAASITKLKKIVSQSTHDFVSFITY